MQLHFYKYQGTGNDFVILDNREKIFDAKRTDIVAQLCDRRFGIGADGFMLLENADGYDFKMVYYNADGNESSMCGNGGRCLVKFAYHLGVFKNECNFIAVDGKHHAFIDEQNRVHLHMIDVNSVEKGNDFHWLDTGSPHYVKFVEEQLPTYDVFTEGKAIRNSERFKEEGTNVNFVQQTGAQSLFVRTYERGVEDETFACGTGVTACALAAHSKGMESPIAIKVLGGDLAVSFNESSTGFNNIYLIGPAEKVFEGTIEIND